MTVVKMEVRQVKGRQSELGSVLQELLTATINIFILIVPLVAGSLTTAVSCVDSRFGHRSRDHVLWSDPGVGLKDAGLQPALT